MLIFVSKIRRFMISSNRFYLTGGILFNYFSGLLFNYIIHPKTHKSENSYRVKIGKIGFYDQLIVNIDHDTHGFIGTYSFNGIDIAPYKSIYFKAIEEEGEVIINWVRDLKFEKVK
jgi:hypothetical protein